jgi:hypothetical protein
VRNAEREMDLRKKDTKRARTTFEEIVCWDFRREKLNI